MSRVLRIAVLVLALFPLSGCVFSIGGRCDSDKPTLEDRVEQLEQRVDTLEKAR